MVSDRAGNALNKAKFIKVGLNQKIYRDFVDSADDRDLYRFRLNKASLVEFSLNASTALVNVSLLNRQGRNIKVAQGHKGTETIQQVLNQGTYYIEVTPGRGQTVRGSYTLKASAFPGQTVRNRSTRPDLSGYGLTLPAELAPGRSFTANFGVQNTGSSSAASTQVAFYLSGDRTITTGDRLLGTYEIGALAAGSQTGLLQTTLTLPTTSGNFFWQGDGTYYIGMVVDPGATVSEANKTNNANLGNGRDYRAVTIQETKRDRPFKIQFDYRFDTKGWFTPDRRAALEAAAAVWEAIILDDFPNVAAGTPIDTRNPEPISKNTAQSTTNEFTYTNLSLNYEIDDLVIFVGTGNLGYQTLALGGPTAWTLTNDFIDRWTGSNFEPWAGSITFNSAKSWFFDSTPSTADDIPSQQVDFISIAIHEIGHVLGFINSTNALTNLIQNNAFTGTNAKFHNGGNPIPLEPDGAHIREGYQFGRSGSAVMDPTPAPVGRQLPTVLELAILNDIGYTVNYEAASENSVGARSSTLSVNGTFQRCGCACCLMTVG